MREVIVFFQSLFVSKITDHQIHQCRPRNHRVRGEVWPSITMMTGQKDAGCSVQTSCRELIWRGALQSVTMGSKALTLTRELDLRCVHVEQLASVCLRSLRV